ncbi:MAG TPA: tripartite tricarboxylate transporter substrate binding protein [Usitatibacter sp.]|nr:tripartite tricarboxylate transporter substrate binding protein [Usitatibacter sp.]
MLGKLAASAALLIAVFSTPVVADTYPGKPIRLIVGAGTGSVSDVRSRWIAIRLARELGQPVVVENRPGAGGSIAAEQAARSPADGHTLFLVHMGILVAPEIYKNLGFDPVMDFAPISRISRGYGVLTVHPGVPATTVQELIKVARENPGKLNYGSTGIGGPPWMMGELFKRLARIEVTHVPYKGGGELLTDLIGGRIDYWLEGALVQVPHIRTGKLRALAVTSPQRLPILPHVPTLVEAGLSDFEFEGWTGLVAPAATPRPVIARLNAAMANVLSSREAVEWLADQANEPAIDTPEGFAAFMRSERAKWAPVVREANAKAQP